MPKDAIIEGYLNREKIVIDEITKHTEIPQAKLKNIIVPKYMAKTTFEKTLKNIQVKRLTDFRFEGNRKIWYVEGVTVQKFKELENYIKDLERKLPKISKEFHNKTLTEKAQEVKWLFSLYQGNMSFLNLMYLLENTPKKEYEKSLELMHRFLKINVSVWKKDKDSEQLVAELFMSIMQTNPFFSDIFKVLDESRKINCGYNKLPDRL